MSPAQKSSPAKKPRTIAHPSPFCRDRDCESCAVPAADRCCIGVYRNCKVIVKPVIYSHIAPVIIVAPCEHAPIWRLSPTAHADLQAVLALVAEAFVRDGKFPNFFTGGNIANAAWGLDGVHAHVHVEPRVADDPAYGTFPAHAGKRALTAAEIETYKDEWRIRLSGACASRH